MISEMSQTEGLLPIATATICRNTILDFDLFIRRPGRATAELYRSATYPIDARDIEKLRRDGVERLYIACEKAEAYRQYLFAQVLNDPAAAPTSRLEAVREATRAAFDEALVASDHNALVAAATYFGDHVARVVASDAIPFHDLFSTLQHDYYTFTHVVNVSVYCLLIAGQAGISNQVELAQIAGGALLHDIGKRHIPACILNKSGRPTDYEWELIREHPVSGFKELAERSDVSWGQLMMVYQHHEKLDGAGYPAGVCGDEIHLWARICAVADVFDALTCRRPYRKALPKADACEHLSRHSGQWFDEGIAARWVQHVRNTP
jgi:HD-GYP domain-containing protein (c-di-GMP phosphodiesterase class II)